MVFSKAIPPIEFFLYFLKCPLLCPFFFSQLSESGGDCEGFNWCSFSGKSSHVFDRKIELKRLQLSEVAFWKLLTHSLQNQIEGLQQL